MNASSERIVEVEGCTSDSGTPNVERERQSCEQGSQSQYWRRRERDAPASVMRGCWRGGIVVWITIDPSACWREP